MSNTELGTKLGDALAYIENAKNVVEHSFTIEDEASDIITKDLANASNIVNELYSNYVKFDQRK